MKSSFIFFCRKYSCRRKYRSSAEKNGFEIPVLSLWYGQTKGKRSFFILIISSGVDEASRHRNCGKCLRRNFSLAPIMKNHFHFRFEYSLRRFPPLWSGGRVHFEGNRVFWSEKRKRQSSELRHASWKWMALFSTLSYGVSVWLKWWAGTKRLLRQPLQQIALRYYYIRLGRFEFI